MNYTPLLIGVLLVLTANAVMSACIWANVSEIRTVVLNIRKELKKRDKSEK